MQVYLPIAEISVNIFAILALGGLTGVLAGMFGVGGGFILTPLLIFIGISPAVAVATSANQIIASSLSGFLAQARRGNVDFPMGNILLAGGMAGSTLGVVLFRWLKANGDIDLIISLAYVVFLTLVGGMMASESVRAFLHKRKVIAAPHAPLQWRARLPWQREFARSNIRVSLLLPLAVGACVGLMVSFMGVGGGFFLVPAMIYLLGMPASVVIGTSLYQIIFITSYVTLLQAITTQTVDIVLALLLLSASVVGVHAGAKLGARLPASRLRGLLAGLVLLMALKLAMGLFIPPENLFTVEAE